MDEVKDFLQIVTYIVAIAGAFGIPLWLRKVTRKLDALNKLAEEQLKTNGGGSMTDRLRALYTQFFPADGPSLPSMMANIASDLKSLESHQLQRATVTDGRHTENIERFNVLEKNQETIRTEGHMQRQAMESLQATVERLGLRQELGAELLKMLFGVLPSDQQTALNALVEAHPELAAEIRKQQDEMALGRGAHDIGN